MGVVLAIVLFPFWMLGMALIFGYIPKPKTLSVWNKYAKMVLIRGGNNG